MNQLAGEKSPYLQMHCKNPVDWYPWGARAFARARETDRPVFLSIGYSSCHWCHVIAHESFENGEVAAALNKDFIAVKVDKEERPDVDAVYMDAVELATSSGGWPMTILTTPQGEPFYAATYLNKDQLLTLIQRAAQLWRTQHAALLDTAKGFVRRMRAQADRPITPRPPTAALTEAAVKDYAASYDSKWGGFGRAPKFPSAHNLLFLLAHYQRTGQKAALEMAEGTLEAMYRGGLFDHVGGGFCRYSVDRQWLVPHFEKMLYDNALLVWAYARAWKATGKTLYRQVARRTADYVLGEMRGPEGQFYSAQDADSEGREGAYYLFERNELLKIMGREDGERFVNHYGIGPAANFEGGSIPNLIGSKISGEEEPLEAMRQKVYAYRRSRMPLARDDKVLTAWNALMVAALCEAAMALDEAKYLDAARRAESFLSTHLLREDGRLFIRYKDDEAKGEGLLADYAFYALALIMLYEAGGAASDLVRAERAARRMLERFGDPRGGLFLYAKDGEQLITRPREIGDGAMPSGNACAALVLGRLFRHTGDAFWRRAARAQLDFVAGAASEAPTAHGFGLLAVSEALR